MASHVSTPKNSVLFKAMINGKQNGRAKPHFIILEIQVQSSEKTEYYILQNSTF
jgi:hypothetical protein